MAAQYSANGGGGGGGSSDATGLSSSSSSSSSSSAVAARERKEPSGEDRVKKDVVAPPTWPMTREQLMDSSGMPRLDVLKAHLLKEGRLEKDLALELVHRCGELLRAEPNMLDLQYPITVCGDVHGQFFDLVRLFEVGGDPKDTQYLFLGDYVDRGCFSSEVVFYLYALKMTYPRKFFMLRGNHECRQLTAFFNFKDECVYKYDEDVYNAIMDSFDHLPLAAIVNKAFFCVHGGLSPEINTLQEIRALKRHREIPREGPMCDLLWSDPYELEGGAAGGTAGGAGEGGGGAGAGGDGGGGGGGGVVASAPMTVGSDGTPGMWFGENTTRQCSFVYGVEAVKRFLRVNKLTSVIRAHEAQVDGYKMQMVNKASGIPRVITIFSAPNYCDVYKNKAACLKFDNNVLNIKQFIDSQHPYYLPNFMDVFQWSLPFVAEKVTDMLASILEYDDGAGDDDSDSDGDPAAMDAMGVSPKRPADASGAVAAAAAGGARPTSPPPAAATATATEAKSPGVLQARGGLLKKKVVAVTKLLRMYKILREHNEAIVQLKQLTPSHKVPFGLLRAGPTAIKKALSSFEQARDADKVNEARPRAKTDSAVVLGGAAASSAAAAASSSFVRHKE